MYGEVKWIVVKMLLSHHSGTLIVWSLRPWPPSFMNDYFRTSSVAASLTQPSSTNQRRPAVDDTPQFGGHYSHSTGDVYRQPSVGIRGPQPHRHPSFDETPGRPYNKVQTLLSQVTVPTHINNSQYNSVLYN
ncbi:hypothetical protein ANCDUO_03694 [Ancylostoma duodenale]|uniref:Uncharacterized protein n=1 Tax=Ancylostoma duodenale TaxID=51022 RepID=A0A0C2GWT3_9BILA|nr:hypothetical protein ANCDUO_03694 [Ancylostoma duodenale]